ncbi:hypothetical protein CDL12_07361 [Handroanthus impetiginosus]|uniref:Uncharacterized protein n=1 Tax=Handroanthus impetiginosus TaxID=429701 RepID=A0A2G9HRP5_9LAMI|nr:hypothetical protein CDL12_07361 [Handroanthus impetiginosus]
MGSRAIQFLSQFPIPVSHNYYRRFVYDNCSNSKTRWTQCFSGGRSGGSRWDWEKGRNPNRRSRFSDAYVTDDYDEEVEFGFRSAAKKRMWWSDDYYAEDDWEEDEGLGILEASIGFNWVLKVFRAFGWMIPAVIISLLLGTGPDSVVMALALPLAQTALSLAIEALWGRPDEKPRPKSKSKKRPFAGAPRRTRMRKEKDIRNRTGKGTTNYKSWAEANDVSSKQKGDPHFGGWDELDTQEPCATPVEKGNEPRTQERIKISRRTKGDTPLLTRLLIAMFPHLGFWIKLF